MAKDKGPCPSMSPAACSQAECRRRKWLVELTEYNLATGYKKDLFGIFDHVAIGVELPLFDDRVQVFGIQSTSRGNISHRIRKITDSPWSRRWLAVPHHRILVWGWGTYQDVFCLKEVELVMQGDKLVERSADGGRHGCGLDTDAAGPL